MSPSAEQIILSSDDRDEGLADRNTFATRVAGKNADPERKALFANVTKRIDYSPKFGTELHGIRLAELTEQQAEELASFTSERGVVFFRDQDDLNHEEIVKLGSHWGPLHVHPIIPHTSANPEVIVLDSRLTFPARLIANNASSSWHSDVSCEPYPASYSILTFDQVPEAGGDTAWSDGYQVYDSLSQPIKDLLEGLTATHSSHNFHIFQEATGRKAFGKFNDSSHPVVRTNPVTGWRSIFTNSGFTREIDNVSPSESK
ncbi:hypothetical protein BGZ94_008373, partial [Podila epigama]